MRDIYLIDYYYYSVGVWSWTRFCLMLYYIFRLLLELLSNPVGNRYSLNFNKN